MKVALHLEIKYRQTVKKPKVEIFSAVSLADGFFFAVDDLSIWLKSSDQKSKK
jgi:hypothetical protein